MIDLAKRSYKKELLDTGNIPFADIQQNMTELNTINTLLGGHAISIKGMKKIIAAHKTENAITICEIGCGGGDNLHAIENWCSKKHISVNFIGIDIKQECIEFAQQQYPLLQCKWIIADYQDINFDNNNKPDIIFSSLFCHHFREEALVSMLQWMQSNSTKGFFINDLQRHWLAYYSIQFITRFFSRSYLVKNDAPLSVARGFLQTEWDKIFADAGIKKYSIQWKWAFRYLIVCNNE